MSVKIGKGAMRFPHHRRTPGPVTVRYECPNCDGPHHKDDCPTSEGKGRVPKPNPTPQRPPRGSAQRRAYFAGKSGGYCVSFEVRITHDPDVTLGEADVLGVFDDLPAAAVAFLKCGAPFKQVNALEDEPSVSDGGRAGRT